MLLTVLIKQKIVTHSAGKTEDIVYTSALFRALSGLIAKTVLLDACCNSRGAVNGGVGGGRPGL